MSAHKWVSTSNWLNPSLKVSYQHAICAHAPQNRANVCNPHMHLTLMNLQEESKLAVTAAWEHKTDARIQQNATQARFETLRAQRAAEIEARRGRLARMLHEEEQALKDELLAAQETPAQRRTAMAGRARLLAAQREEKRQVCGSLVLGGCKLKKLHGALHMHVGIVLCIGLY